MNGYIIVRFCPKENYSAKEGKTTELGNNKDRSQNVYLQWKKKKKPDVKG